MRVPSIPTLASILGVARAEVKTDGTPDRIRRHCRLYGQIEGSWCHRHDLPAHRNDQTVQADIKSVIATLRKNGFSAVNTTNGTWDLIAEIEVPNMNEFHRLVTGIRAMDGIAKSETHIFLGPA